MFADLMMKDKVEARKIMESAFDISIAYSNRTKPLVSFIKNYLELNYL